MFLIDQYSKVLIVPPFHNSLRYYVTSDEKASIVNPQLEMK